MIQVVCNTVGLQPLRNYLVIENLLVSFWMHASHAKLIFREPTINYYGKSLVSYDTF